MTKKWLILLSSGALIALLLVGLAGGWMVASAQESTSTSNAFGPFGWGGRGRGLGFGQGFGGQAGLEAAAKALGMTADALSTQLWGGRTLADLADKAGVDLQTVRDAVDAACQAATKDAIEQAVEDGYLSREQADWMLEGLGQGFFPMGGGFGFGRGWGRGW